MYKKIAAIFLTLIFIFSTAVNAFAATNIEALEENITETYKSALSLADRSSFHGSCNLATAYQLQVLGIFKNGIDYSGAGNKWYDYYKDKSKTSGGYSVVTVSGKNCLYDLVAKYGNEIYNIVYSMGTGGTSGPMHVMLIRAIIDGMVYFNDSFGCTYSGKYYPEGSCTVLTLDKFVKSYREMNGDAYGCIYFTNGASNHIIGSTNNETTVNYKTGSYVITAEPSLRIRQSASTESTTLGSIPNGEIVTVTQINGNWGKTTYSGVTGWISLDYAAEISVDDNLRVNSVKASKTDFALTGDSVIWQAKASGSANGVYYYAFTILRDNTVVYTTGFSSSDSVKYKLDKAGTYCVLAKVVDSENRKAETYSDELICYDSSSILKGDVDGNGKVTSGDARHALRAAANLEQLQAKAFIAADYDGNGKVTAGDARHILRKAAKLEN